MKKWIFLILAIVSINSQSYFSTDEIRNRFNITNRSSNNFHNYSKKIINFKNSHKMGSYETVKCRLSRKTFYIINGKISIQEFRVYSCYKYEYGNWKYININSIYILGSGIEHRFSGAKEGENLIFPRLAFFYGNTGSTFLY